MKLKNESELENTRRKLAMLEDHIEKARLRPRSAVTDMSIASLEKMANQLREEIDEFTRWQAAAARAADVASPLK